MHIQNFIKIHPFVLKILRLNTFLHQSKAITLLFTNEFSPFAIPNHSTLILMSMQRLKKLGQKLLKLESGNNIFTSIKGHNFVVYNWPRPKWPKMCWRAVKKKKKKNQTRNQIKSWQLVFPRSCKVVKLCYQSYIEMKTILKTTLPNCRFSLLEICK